VTVKFAVDAEIPFSLGYAVNVIACKMVAIPTIEDEDANGAASPHHRGIAGRVEPQLAAADVTKHRPLASRLSGLCPAFPLRLVLCGASRCTQDAEFPERRPTDPHNLE
jgi:hypothetical protein